MCLLNRTPLCIGSNIFLSVVIVLLNKLVYVNTGFPNVTLTFVHFVFTFVGLQLCEKLNIFNIKRLPVLRLLPVALSFCGFVVFTNLSLGYNTVGTYQIFKTLTMPTVMVIQKFLYKKTFPLKIQLTLIPICIGVTLNSAYDIKLNFIGTTFALTAVVITSFYQVWVGEKQKEFQVDSMQLLYYLAPLSASFLFVCLPVVEPPWIEGGLLIHHWTFHDILLVLTSSLVAFLINLSIYWIIGNTSAITYNVVGQTKFCLTLFGGYLFFKEPVLPIQLLGILMTFLGVSLYAYVKTEDQKHVQQLPTLYK